MAFAEFNIPCPCGCGRFTDKNGRYPKNQGSHEPRDPGDLRGPNPSGLCICGCNRPTGVAKTTKNGLIKGLYVKFIKGHQKKLLSARLPDDPKGPNPSGKCRCGCGGDVPIATESRKGRGPNRLVNGCYVSFLKNHDKRMRSGIGNRNGALCECGCGKPTPIATFTRYGNIKGQPRRFFNPGHAQRCEHTLNTITGCWELNGRNGDGYSRIRRGGRPVLGHIWYWEQQHGPIPAGMELDHTCRNRCCVRPDHMELVTHAENMRRIREYSQIPDWNDGLKPTIDIKTGCHVFPFVQEDGYARLWVAGSLLMAHRVFYELQYGQIEGGLTLDHLCCNRACVNPEHLEPVTTLENSRRSRLTIRLLREVN